MEFDAEQARLAAEHKRRIALNTINEHARAALQHQKKILELVREHGFPIPLPPDRPLLELITHIAVLKHPSSNGKPEQP